MRVLLPGAHPSFLRANQCGEKRSAGDPARSASTKPEGAGLSGAADRAEPAADEVVRAPFAEN